MKMTMVNVLRTSQKYYIQLAHLLEIAVVPQFLALHFCYQEDVEISSGPVATARQELLICKLNDFKISRQAFLVLYNSRLLPRICTRKQKRLLQHIGVVPEIKQQPPSFPI